MATWTTSTTGTHLQTLNAAGTGSWSLQEFNAPSVTLDGTIVLDRDSMPCSISIRDILDRLDKPELTYEDVTSLREQGNDVVVNYDKISGEYKSIVHLIPKVKKTYVNHRTVIVKFEDGTFEKATATDDDYFSTETGVCICLFKKVLDRLVSGHGSSVYNKLMDYTLSKGVENSEKKTKKQSKKMPKKRGHNYEKSKKA